jgi:hypothetical protein
MKLNALMKLAVAVALFWPVQNVHAADGVINACVNRITGAMRIITHAPASRCRVGEYPLSWNLIGPQGPAGVQGATGLQGPIGLTGAQGEQGTPGPRGDIGPQGASGATGSQGVQGEPGLKGDKGDPGSKGEKGDIGPPGTPSAIKVYDANNQDLGIYVRHESGREGVRVLIPGINLFAIIDPQTGYPSHRSVGDLYFEESGCTGNNVYYTDPSLIHWPKSIFWSAKDGGKLYVVNEQFVNFSYKSHGSSPGFGEFLCTTLESGWHDTGYTVTELLIEDLPFTLPVTFPLRYEAQ